MNKNKISRGIFWSLIGIIIMFFLLKSVNVSDFKNLFLNLDERYLILSFVLYVIVYVLRARRFRFLLDNKISFSRIFSITCIHNFFNMILPARLGEFSYSVMLKRESVGLTASLSHIIVSRIYDLLGILLLFSVSLVFYLSGYLKIYAILSIFVIFLGYVIFSFFLKKIIYVLNRLNTENNLLRKIRSLLSDILINLSAFSNKDKAWLIFNSLLINLLMFIFGYVLVKGFGVDLSVWAVFVGGTLAFLTTILPIQGLFNLGTMELGWVFAYVLVGMTNDQAILTGFFYHLINIIFTIVMFIFGLLINRTGIYLDRTRL